MIAVNRLEISKSFLHCSRSTQKCEKKIPCILDSKFTNFWSFMLINDGNRGIRRGRV